jgi:hypothetical protein
MKQKISKKTSLIRPYVAYEPLNNCDSHNRNTTTTTWKWKKKLLLN